MFPLLNRNVPHVEGKIISYLEPKDLAASMLVSKEWCQRAKPFLYEWYSHIQRRNGDVPLQMAAVHGYDHLVAFFLQNVKYGLNEICSHTGKTALMEAALKGNDRIAKMLLETKDIDVNMVSDQVQYVIPHSTLVRISHRCNALELAASNGHAGIVKLLVERGDIDVNATCSPFGHTALMEAVINMQASAVEELLKHPDIDVNMVDDNGHTALSRAKGLPAWPGYLKERQKIIEMLKEKGAK